MKKIKVMIKKYIFCGILAAASASAINAQTNTYSGYFLDNYLYRHQMNPALGNDNGFVGFPALGNVSLGMQGNLSLSKFLYNHNGKTVLFTNPYLPDNEVKKFGNKNSLGINLRENILNVGFKAFGGYNSIGVSAVLNSQVAAPGSLFNMLREGIENKTYDIKDLMVAANSYAEIALNHSRDIKQVPGLRVGATFKFLVGIANVYGKFKKAHMTLGQDSWDIVSEGDIYVSGKGIDWETDYNEDARRYYVNGIKADNISAPNGFGAAIDLGATYKWRDFNFSLAILVLGGIHWSNTKKASTNGEHQFKTDDYVFEVNGDDDLWDQMKDDISALYQLEPVDGNFNRSTMQGTTLNLGVEYELPYYRPLTFGLLNTTRMCGGYSWTEFRLSANVMPVKYISTSVNAVCGTFGFGFGWLLNISSGKGFNLFLGMDRVPGKLAKQFAPLDSNANFNFGINFPF